MQSYTSVSRNDFAVRYGLAILAAMTALLIRELLSPFLGIQISQLFRIRHDPGPAKQFRHRQLPPARRGYEQFMADMFHNVSLAEQCPWSAIPMGALNSNLRSVSRLRIASVMACNSSTSRPLSAFRWSARACWMAASAFWILFCKRARSSSSIAPAYKSRHNTFLVTEISSRLNFLSIPVPLKIGGIFAFLCRSCVRR